MKQITFCESHKWRAAGCIDLRITCGVISSHDGVLKKMLIESIELNININNM